MTNVSRLINTFTPTHYDLSLTIDRENRAFRGVATINGSLVRDSSYIPLHTQELTVTNTLIDGKAAQFTIEKGGELRVSQPSLATGEHITVIEFEGMITDAMHGMYPCYFEHDGTKKELIATQFESHHAREVFPCVDEPEAKATFDVTLTTDQGIEVLGNMPIDWQRTENNQLVTAFQTTPRMSTYLLAWVVGEMHRKTAKTKNDVEVSVWATPAQPAAALDFPLEVAVRAIEFYEEYYGVAYPLPKADHVALPDFSSGAMENWGLITYREIALLADPATTSVSNRQYVATVIAHELAHQWFGNLVTMKWWNNLWLNESFANMMEYVAVDALYPQWNIWLDQASNENVMALRRDAIDGVQAVQVDVNHPDEISTLFDGAIVYAKGGRLLRMLQSYVGEEAFRKGLTDYFTKFAYQNTEGNDLWDAISHASGKDITGLMNTWISQSGYPIVHVSRDSDSITLRQEQFFIGDHEPSDKLWPIPLASTSTDIPELMNTREVTVPAMNTSTLLMNHDATTHYLPHYNQTLTDELLIAIRAGDVSEIDRLSYLNDVILLARAGVMTTAELLPIIKAFANETSEPVWGLIAMTLAELRKFVEDSKEAETALRILSANVARAQYQRLGWKQQPGEPEGDTKLRGLVISLMIYGEDTDALRIAKDLYDNSPIESLDPELRSVILSSVVRHDQTGQIVNDLLKLYTSTQNAELALDICSGITSTRDATKIDLLLESIKNSDIVRPQDVARWFVYLIRGRDARAKTWQWLQDNWGWIETTFGGDKSYDDYPRYAATGLMTERQLAEYIEFFTPKQTIPALSRVISLGITEISARVDVIKRDKDGVITALVSKA
ncbi:MAG TPA: M1 family metallopeptidase [Candidatus Saccharibacteria bacterium]|nr:M1 family metallopeptidase [Candidatus Saccharibacteria bacterium]